MNELTDNIELQHELNRIAPPTKECPECGAALPVQTVKKANKNQGRPFIACWACEFFHWEDLPKCRSCGEELVTFTVKKETKNKGRQFRVCPNKCEFRWLDTITEEVDT